MASALAEADAKQVRARGEADVGRRGAAGSASADRRSAGRLTVDRLAGGSRWSGLVERRSIGPAGSARRRATRSARNRAAGWTWRRAGGWRRARARAFDLRQGHRHAASSRPPWERRALNCGRPKPTGGGRFERRGLVRASARPPAGRATSARGRPPAAGGGASVAPRAREARPPLTQNAFSTEAGLARAEPSRSTLDR